MELSRRGLDHRKAAIAALPASAFIRLTTLDRAVQRAATERARLFLEAERQCQALQALHGHKLGGVAWQRRLTRRLHLEKDLRSVEGALRMGYDLQMGMERRRNYSMRWLTRHAQRVWLVGGLEAVRLLCAEGRALHARLEAELAVALSDDAFDGAEEEKRGEVDALERGLRCTARRLASVFAEARH